MDENDWDIFYWAVNRKEPPPRWKDSALLEKCVPRPRPLPLLPQPHGLSSPASPLVLSLSRHPRASPSLGHLGD